MSASFSVCRVHIYLWTSHFLTIAHLFTCFNHSAFSYSLYMSNIDCSKCLSPVFVCTGQWEREFSEERADQRTFLGKKYTKVVMMHRAGKKKRKSLSQVVLLRTNKCIQKQSELWNAFSICEVQPASLLFITVCLMINLTLCSYFMYHLKATTRQREFLLWQQ